MSGTKSNILLLIGSVIVAFIIAEVVIRLVFPAPQIMMINTMAKSMEHTADTEPDTPSPTYISLQSHPEQGGVYLETPAGKRLRPNIDVNDFLRKCLEQRRLEIQEEMEKLGREQLQVRLEKHIIGMPASRYMPAKIERIIRAQYGDVCSEAGCTKPAAHIHHQKPFALFGSHDPRHLRPLCKAHHELAHAGEGGFRGGG